MSERCAVETLAEFGFWAKPTTSGITLDFGEHVFIFSGSDEVLVFDLKEKKLKGVLQFPSCVNNLDPSEDKQRLFVSCRCAVYCVHLPPILSRFSTSQSSSPMEFKITSEDMVIRDERVLCLLEVGTVLVTLSQRDTSWLFTVNKPEEHSGLYQTLGSFSLPIIPEVTEDRKPVMNYVCPSDSSFSSETHLEPTLFKLLFGLDSALIKSPVVLCGLPDGRLCSLPVRLPAIRVLHSLEEPVVFVGASVVVETEAAGGPSARCLVAVGERGRVLAIKTREGAPGEGGARAGFTEGCVPGPVMSACVDKSSLYLSSGPDLLTLRLTEESRGEDGQDQSEPNLQNYISLNVCGITALTKPAVSAAGEVELLCLSEKGQLKRVSVPKTRADGESSVQLKPQAGRSVKDLLSAIGDVCERASDLKTSIKSKNLILQRLNQVLNVSFLLLNAPEGTEQPVRCHATTKWTTLLQRDSLHLTCVLENNSPYFLEQGWTLNITVHPLSGSQEKSESTNYAFPFCNLHPGQKLDVTLPLTAAADKLFPVTISCNLVFSLGTLLDEQQLAALLKTPNSVISLPLSSLTVDWLHALQLNTSGNDRNMSSCPRVTASDALRGFLKSKGKDKAEKKESKEYSASVKVSSELIRDTLISSGDSKKSLDLCVVLLDWLLTEPHRGVTGQQWQSSTNSAVQCEAPNGHFIKLITKEVSVGDEKESLSAVEIQIESVSLAAVCGLHHATLDRIEGLVRRAPRRSSSLRAESLGLRPALLRTERLLQQLHESSVSGASGVGVSRGLMTRSHLKVYQELRQHPLVIL